MKENKLKPCPFCGGDARVFEAHDNMQRKIYGVACVDCIAIVSFNGGTKEQEAIEAWNRRVNYERD